MSGVDKIGVFGFGIEHCYNPGEPYETTTKATCFSISLGKHTPINLINSFNLGVGDDFYSEPITFVTWGR